jgi:D-threo-aldose 1-dehydrogenase
MQATEKRKLGRTDIEVSVMGFGAAPLGNMYAAFSDEQANDTVRAAFGAGVTLFDTAPFYGHGLSEHRLGAALRGVPRDDYVLSTKIGRLLRPRALGEIDMGIFNDTLPFDPVFDYSYDAVMRSVDDSLQRMGTNRIDVLLIHDVDIWTHGTKEANDARIDEVMSGGYRAMRKLRDEGVVGAIGAGLNEWEVCQTLMARGEFDCFLLAGRYTLLEQDGLATFLPDCVARGVSIIIGGPYNTGILATGAVEGAMYNYAPAEADVMARVAQIEHVCEAHGVALASAAIQFPLHHPAVASVIPGARAPEEVARNITQMQAEIPAALWADLKQECLIAAEAPTG